MMRSRPLEEPHGALLLSKEHHGISWKICKKQDAAHPAYVRSEAMQLTCLVLLLPSNPEFWIAPGVQRHI